MAFVPGQRWFSTAEPELGLGTVMRLAGRSVQIVYTGSGVVRHYAIASAPLVRAAFRIGDVIRVDGRDWTVEQIGESTGLLNYQSGTQQFHEGQLDAEQPVSKADSRLLNGRIDRNDQFAFRLETLRRRAEAQMHPGWGMLGARIDLIPHQLRVAEVAAARRPPRLLLADEVGLGKTIEACLIMAQQMAAGRVQRVLVLVPESLLHQWFVELLRRFNLRFALFDEERCESMEQAGESADPSSANPFEDEQGVIASVDWLARREKRARQACAAGWDMLVVDEAHHLGWTPSAASNEYLLVESLAGQTPVVILLTATPEQLGRTGHFARLRLLDPARYSDLDQFLLESERLQEVSRAVDALESGRALGARQTQALADMFDGDEGALQARLAGLEGAEAEDARQHLIDALIDRHGVGRSMIRNRRAAVGGFPQRHRHISLLEAEDGSMAKRLHAEFLADVGAPGHAEPEHDYTRDPRMDHLLQVLEQIAPAKLLLLCRSRSKVQALDEALRSRSGIQVARFHEDMNLLQRDRNAAFFADPDGARLLIASEIGAEGRNFQFAQHLFLWDLPLDPDMLEQRIGRLDRIGQRGDVQLHVPCLRGSAQHVLCRWLDEGLDAFTEVAADGRELLRSFGERVIALAGHDQDPEEQASDIDALIAETRARHAELSAIIHGGRDRLLEISSQRGAADGVLLRTLAEEDAQARYDDYPLRLLEQFGIHNELLAAGVHLLDPEYLTLDAFEEFKHGPRAGTLDRQLALARDDLLYLRADHPLILSAQEYLLSAETGNAAFLIDDALPPRTVLLEAVFVLECIADRRLNISRFLPPEPLTCVVDTRLQLRSGFQPSPRAVERAAERNIDLIRYRKPLSALIPPMLKCATESAQRHCSERATAALAAADRLLGHEWERLQALARVNPAVRPEEILELERERAAINLALPGARPRLDALRVIASPDFLRMLG